jgi:K+-sensing histidine kinase KdpD
MLPTDPPSSNPDQAVSFELRVVQDMLHQLKAPLSLATRYSDLIQSETTEMPRVNRHASILHGLLRKAISVTSSMRLLRAMHSGVSIPRIAQSVSSAQLFRLVSECAADLISLQDANRRLRVEIDRSSFDQITPTHFSADTQLIEQAVLNILDNAFKYSYSDTIIRVRAASEEKCIRVEIVNQGLKIQSNETRRALERGWRGDAAMAVTGEGSGLGLWLANAIAGVHGGFVEIRPTNTSGDTIVAFILSTSI